MTVNRTRVFVSLLIYIVGARLVVHAQNLGKSREKAWLLARDDDEMKGATRERDTWGAAWCRRDFDFFTGQEFRILLQVQKIKLVTWRQLVHLEGDLNLPHESQTACFRSVR
jgi:hypothetical protein